MFKKCSKCDTLTEHIYFRTDKIELCLDCSIEALNFVKGAFPSYKIFIENWTIKRNN